MDAALDAALDAEGAFDIDEDEFDCDDHDNSEDEGEGEGLILEERSKADSRLASKAKAAAPLNVSSLVDKPPPSNFSAIDTSRPKRDILKEFPLFKNAQPLDVEIRAGEMLYLPAGWFHEVTSYGDASSPLHMAFNYW